MRSMTDIDILYRNADLKQLRSIFEAMGYQLHKIDPDDVSFFKSANEVKVEMQQQLIDRGYTKWYHYLEDIWDRCTPVSSHEYVMSHEDFYIYHIIHLAKHFRNGGLGINQLMDIYIMNNAYKNIDFEYINSRLQNLGLRRFFENIQLLLDVWFLNRKVSSEEEITISLLNKYIFYNGAFGRVSQGEINIAVGNDKTNVSLLRKIFPDYNTMNSYYGGPLSKYPWLLPFYWIRINVKRLFTSGKDFQNLQKSMASITDERIENTKELMKRCEFDMKI